MQASSRLSMALALALVWGGAWWSVRTLRTAGERRTQLERKARELAELRELAGDGQLDQALFARVSAGGPGLPDLAALLQETLPGSTYRLNPGAPVRLAGEFNLQVAEVTFEEITLAELSRFVVKAEGAARPWRVASISIQARTEARGAGRVRLVLQGLGRMTGT